MKFSIAALTLAAALAVSGTAEASRPVPKTVTGCVIGGTFTDGQYTYKVRSRSGSAIVETNIARYEGKLIRIQGSLLPGDVLIERRIKVLSPSCTLTIR